MIAKPFVKWAGGKTSSLPEILSRLPTKMHRYYEPFVGGGAVFFALAAEGRFKRAVLNDINEELATTYLAVQGYHDRVIKELHKHAVAHNESYFYTMRGERNAMRADRPHAMSRRAARLIYLNETCFNGLYRVNKKGEFNVPFGAYKNPNICDPENLQAASEALYRATVHSVDFAAVAFQAQKGDAVYFDPPYVPVSETASFAAYAKGGFGPYEQERLRDAARLLAKRGVHVLLSNSDTPFVRKLYKGFKLEKVRVRRAINSKGDKRGEVGELIISGGA